MKIFKMTYKEYEKAFSTARLIKYQSACNGNANDALTLYRYNIKLCQKFYGILNIFEVVLRNAIDAHYKAHFNDSDWICSQLQPGGMLDSSPHKVEIEKTISSLVKQGKYTHDRLVSSVTFGFWTYMFTKRPYKVGGQNLLAIFPNKTFGLGQKAIYKELMLIKSFRNKIAHHEAICFDASGKKSIVPAMINYDLILKYITFLGYQKNHLFYGLDIMPDAILDKINEL